MLPTNSSRTCLRRENDGIKKNTAESRRYPSRVNPRRLACIIFEFLTTFRRRCNNIIVQCSTTTARRRRRRTIYFVFIIVSLLCAALLLLSYNNNSNNNIIQYLYTLSRAREMFIGKYVCV